MNGPRVAWPLRATLADLGRWRSVPTLRITRVSGHPSGELYRLHRDVGLTRPYRRKNHISVANGSKPSAMADARRWTRRWATSSKYHIDREGAQRVVHCKAGVGRRNHSVPCFANVHLFSGPHSCLDFRHWVQYHTRPSGAHECRSRTLLTCAMAQSRVWPNSRVMRSACTPRQWPRLANVLKCAIAGAGLFSSVNRKPMRGEELGLECS